MRRTLRPSHSIATARSRVVRTSPTLPPSTSSASAMALAQDRHADIVEDRRDRGMRLVERDPHRDDLREAGDERVGDRGGGGFDEPEAVPGEGARRRIDDGAVGHGVGELVAAAGLGKVDREFEIDHEALADLLLMGHHAVMAMDEKPVHEDHVAHALLLIAAMMRMAWTVSATSWVRMSAAPFSTARICAAIEPPSRRSGGVGATQWMNRLRDAPTRT